MTTNVKSSSIAPSKEMTAPKTVEKKETTIGGAPVQVKTEPKKDLSVQGKYLFDSAKKTITFVSPVTKGESIHLDSAIGKMTDDFDSRIGKFNGMLKDSSQSIPEKHRLAVQQFETLSKTFNEIRSKVESSDLPRDAKDIVLKDFKARMLQCLKEMVMTSPEIAENLLLGEIVKASVKDGPGSKEVRTALDELGKLVGPPAGDGKDAPSRDKLASCSKAFCAPGPDWPPESLASVLDKVSFIREVLGQAPNPDLDMGLLKSLDQRLQSVEKEYLSALTAKLAGLPPNKGGIELPPGTGVETSEKLLNAYYESLLDDSKTGKTPGKTVSPGEADKAFNTLTKDRDAYIGARDKLEKLSRSPKSPLPQSAITHLIRHFDAKIEEINAKIDRFGNLSAVANLAITDRGKHDEIILRRDEGVKWRGLFGSKDTKTLSALQEKIKYATVDDKWKERMTRGLQNAAVTGKLPPDLAKELLAFIKSSSTGKQKIQLGNVIAKLDNTGGNDVPLTPAEVSILLPVLERSLTKSEAEKFTENIKKKSGENLASLSGRLEELRKLVATPGEEWPSTLSGQFESLKFQAERILLSGDKEKPSKVLDKEKFFEAFDKAISAYQKTRFDRTVNEGGKYLSKFPSLDKVEKDTLDLFCCRANSRGEILDQLLKMPPAQLKTFLADLEKGGKSAVLALDILLEGAPHLQNEILGLKQEYGGQEISEWIATQHLASSESKEIKYLFSNLELSKDATPEARKLFEKFRNSTLAEIPELARTLLLDAAKNPPEGLAKFVNVGVIDLLLMRAAYHGDQVSDTPSFDFAEFIKNELPVYGGQNPDGGIYLGYLERRLAGSDYSLNIDKEVSQGLRSASNKFLRREKFNDIIKALARDPEQGAADTILRRNLLTLLERSEVDKKIIEGARRLPTDELLDLVKKKCNISGKITVSESTETSISGSVRRAQTLRTDSERLRGDVLTKDMEEALAQIDESLPNSEKILARGHVRFTRIHGQQMALGIYALNVVLDQEIDTGKGVSLDEAKKQVKNIKFQTSLDFRAMRGGIVTPVNSHSIQENKALTQQFHKIRDSLINAKDIKEFNEAKKEMLEFYEKFNLGNKAETIILLQGKRFKKTTFGSHDKIKSTSRMSNEDIMQGQLKEITGKLKSVLTGSTGDKLKELVTGKLEKDHFGKNGSQRARSLANIALTQHYEKKEWHTSSREMERALKLKNDGWKLLTTAAEASIVDNFRNHSGTDFSVYLNKIGTKGSPERQHCLTTLMALSGCTKEQAELVLTHSINNSFTKSDISRPSIIRTGKQFLQRNLNIFDPVKQGMRKITGTKVDTPGISSHVKEFCQSRVKPGQVTAIDLATGGGVSLSGEVGPVSISLGIQLARKHGISISVDKDGVVSFALARGFSADIDAAITVLEGTATLGIGGGIGVGEGVVLQFKDDGNLTGRQKFEMFFGAFCEGGTDSRDLELFSSVETFTEIDTRFHVGLELNPLATVKDSLENLGTLIPDIQIKASVDVDEHSRTSTGGSEKVFERQFNVSLSGRVSVTASNVTDGMVLLERETVQHPEKRTEGRVAVTPLGVAVEGKYHVVSSGLLSRKETQGKLAEATQTFTQKLGGASNRNAMPNLAATVQFYNIQNDALLAKMLDLTQNGQEFTLHVEKQLNPDVLEQINRMPKGPNSEEAQKLLADSKNYVVSGFRIEYTNIEKSSRVGLDLKVVNYGESISGSNTIQQKFSA